MVKHPKIGSVSHGTMRSVDLLSTFADVLEDYIKANADDVLDALQTVLDDARALQAVLGDGDDFDEDAANPDTLDAMVEELFDALDGIAPPYCTFGAHEGDGADYGFWPCLESLEEAAYEGDDVIKVEDMSQVPASWRGYVMQVSDHGNVTLLEPVVTHREVWSVV